MLLKSKMLKTGVATLVAAGLLTSMASGVMAHDKAGKGKRGGKIIRLCSGEAAQKMNERAMRISSALDLTPQQQNLFDNLQAQRASVFADVQPICAKITDGERPSKEIRKELRKVFKEAKREGKESRKAFKNSLTDAQIDKMKEMRKAMRDKRKNG
ncbi:MAG: Spy/CpxP family protein refolding chaperone [Alphaproteobacteria bacterium]